MCYGCHYTDYETGECSRTKCIYNEEHEEMADDE